jgi:hypothetical protein
MPFFTVLLHGAGIEVPDADSGRPMRGFFTSRTLWARDAQEASAKALTSVANLWSKGKYAESNAGGTPTLSVDSCALATFMQWLRAPNRGHSFYRESNGAT